MTLNKFLEAVAEKLVGLWPDRHVFVNEIPKDSDGNFFVGIIEATQEKKLDRRRRRHVQIEVLYFLASKDTATTRTMATMAFGRLCIWHLRIWYPIQQTPTGPISYSGTSRRLILLLFPTAHRKPETAWFFRRAVLPIRRATPFPTSGKGRLIPALMSS